MKVDNGPGRNQIEALAQLRNNGIYVFLGVPNTTSVSQETDQNCGVFKSIYRENREKMVNDQNLMQKPTNLSLPVIGILIFGGTDPVTGENHFCSAFDEAFSKEKCLGAWAKVGAAPCTRKCLNSAKVCHQLGDDLDPMATMYKVIQQQNGQHGFTQQKPDKTAPEIEAFLFEYLKTVRQPSLGVPTAQVWSRRPHVFQSANSSQAKLGAQGLLEGLVSHKWKHL
ncbi:unnamed protein product [Cylindrotheca closterium]|uniref:Uncharacterized protein n=1 Tax=Cylindrotheca closterium TaxID=2856 RepID=A0AAD2CJ71_9STRA|nr:unnamed protein product [Cylindrotheca closterium]